MQKKSNKALKIIGRILGAIFVAVCFVVIFFNLTHEYHVISGESMTPTLNANSTDGVFVSKIKGYGRGDIIVVNKGEKDEHGNDILVIKRLIAMAGDKICIKEINGEYRIIIVYAGQDEQTVLDEPYLSGYEQNASLMANFNYMITKNGYELDSDGFFEIPQEEIFYLGDNRLVSKDCSTYGTKKQSLVIGVVDYIVYGNTNPYGQVLKQVFGGGA
ncbi:MAG: signal peptidase I [Clostridia bacterium]|nr:signal peptidase I [Clostridia bacterium]